MPKIRSRMDYAREMQDEIRGVVEYAFDRLNSLHDIHLKLHQTGTVWFDDTLEDHQKKAKLKEKEEKVTKLYKELDSYTKQSRYAEVYRAFMIELKDEDDEEKWGPIFNKYRNQILDFKHDMNMTHQDFLATMTEVFKIVTTQKRKEKEHEMMKDTPIEEYVKNEERIRKVLYEKCSAGEITLDEREAALAQLNTYTESARNFTESINKAVEDYCEGTITCDELDTILNGYYKENPEQAMYFTGKHLDNRFDAMKNEIVNLCEAGAIDLETAAQHVEYLESVYDITLLEHMNCLTESTDHPMIDAMSDGMDQYFEGVREFKESAQDGENDLAVRVEGLDNFVDRTWNCLENSGVAIMGESADDVAEVVIESALIGIYIACTAIILSSPIGALINMKKGSNVIKAYQDLHPDAVKYSEFDIAKMSIDKTAAKYIPEIEKLMSGELRTRGKCYLAKYKRKPFAVIARLQYFTSGTSVDNGGGVSSYSSSAAYRYFFKALCPEAEKHKEFYEAALMLKKFKVNTPEIKEFAKDVKSECEELKKKIEKEEKENKKKEQLAKSEAEARVAKEAAGITYDNDQLYGSVRKQLMDKYISGEITLEQREAALMEAKDRIFGENADVTMEGFFGNFLNKKNTPPNMKELSSNVKSHVGNCKKITAQFKANSDKIRAITNKCKEIESKMPTMDSARRKQATNDLAKLRAELTKLNEVNKKLNVQMQQACVNESVDLNALSSEDFTYLMESMDDLSENLTLEETQVMMEGIFGNLLKKKKSAESNQGTQQNETSSPVNKAAEEAYRKKYATLKKQYDDYGAKLQELSDKRRAIEDNRIKMVKHNNQAATDPSGKIQGKIKTDAEIDAVITDKNHIAALTDRVIKDQMAVKKKMDALKENYERSTKQNFAKLQTSMESVGLDMEFLEAADWNFLMEAFSLLSNEDNMVLENSDVLFESLFDKFAAKVSNKVADHAVSKMSQQKLNAKFAANEAEIHRLEKVLLDLQKMLRSRNMDPITEKRLRAQKDAYEKKCRKLHEEDSRIRAHIDPIAITSPATN